MIELTKLGKGIVWDTGENWADYPYAQVLCLPQIPRIRHHPCMVTITDAFDTFLQPEDGAERIRDHALIVVT